MSDIKIITCQNCGGNIKLDFDDLISYCPYCSAAITLDMSQVKDIFLEREKTKQTAEIEQTKREKEKSDRLVLIGVFGLFAFMLVIAMVALLIEK